MMQLKPTGSNCYSRKGWTFPMPFGVDWDHLVPFPFWWDKTRSNQPEVIVFDDKYEKRAKHFVDAFGETTNLFIPLVVVKFEKEKDNDKFQTV